MKHYVRIGIVGFVSLVLWLSCGKPGETPRDRVLQFVRLVQSDTMPDIRPFLDVDSVATYEYSSPKFDSLSLQDKKNRLAKGFIKDGEYRSIWSRAQIVVNEETLLNDTTATVEVSFIDRSTRIQYYSQMGLKKRNAGWVICSFKVN